MGNGKQVKTPSGAGTFAFHDVLIDAGAHRLLRGGHEISIEPKAFAVLLQFVSQQGQLLSRDDLLDAVWGHVYVTPATVNRIVAQLRRALGDNSEHPRFIQTVHGLGYRFIASLEEAPANAAPSLRFTPPARARLPARVAQLIGREHNIEELRRLCCETRLVTVTGPGGVGKTQTALETARLIAADFPDGVWWFDCSAQTDGDRLVRGLAGAFDIRPTANTDELIARLGDLLAVRHVLLVFDNCERMTEPLGKTLATLLARCVDLHVLVTSQHRLNCAGESLYLLPLLDVPPHGQWKSGEEIARLTEVPSVRLLLMRSRACASSFALTAANAAAVAELCRRLDGLPLALELAAARLRLLSPEQLLARMDDGLLRLAEANPARPARHQTLHTLIEWSFALLSEREQSLLTGVSVFPEVCTLGGANAVGAVFGFDGERTLELLSGVIDKSLLTVDTTTNPPSYRLLDSVRLFALKKLAESGDEARVRDAHLAHFVQLTERVDAGIRGDRQQLWSERVEHERANLHAAFDHALTRPELAESALALVGNLCWFFRSGTDYVESARWVDRALAVAHLPTRHLALALIAGGMISHQSQQHERAALRLRKGIALATRLGDTWLAAAGQSILAFELATVGDFARAEDCVESALAVAVAQNDAWLRSMALLGRGIADALNGRHRQAEACLSEAFDLVSPPGSDVFQQAYTLINLALQRFYLGDARGAAGDWLHDLVPFIALRHWRGAAGCVEGAAYLAAEHGHLERAARFLAAAARVRKLTGAPLLPQWQKAQGAAEQKAREGLGERFDRSGQEGATERFEKIVDEARAMLSEIASGQLPRTTANSPSGS
ncbi:MAG: winged helix-turn-helix domain-containing protein [Rhodanobacter sp.]